METREFERSDNGSFRVRTSRRGRDLLCDGLLNKGTEYPTIEPT